MKKPAKTKKTRLIARSSPPLTAKSPPYEGQTFDIMIHAWMANFMGSLSPAAFKLAFMDWLLHLNISPAKKMDMMVKAFQQAVKLVHALQCELTGKSKICLETRATDRRFKGAGWDQFPFNLFAHSFLLNEQWWDEFTCNIRGVSDHHRQVVNFSIRQWLDLFSPSNCPWTNPEVIEKTLNTSGSNFFRGFNNWLEDCYRLAQDLPPAGTDKFKVGKDVAVTPGKVIFRNRLIELIQYQPATQQVYAEPVLIIPAWIMKYYILDLSPHNSLVKYLVENKHTVFMISWKNPGSEDRDLSLEDYLESGIFEALSIINKLMPDTQVHTLGYCIGGTLLMIAAALLAHRKNIGIKTITLLAAQVDFKDAGELLTFVDESQITFLEDIMWERGYLDGVQMAGAFSMLHSNDLIWSRMVQDYLLGRRRPMTDLVAWDNDTTRLPFRMHSEYLRSLFLKNDLAQGQFQIGEQRIALPDVHLPIFAVGTTSDHISPWKSVYKIHLFCDTEVTFVLTTGGHNAGIVSEPGHPKRSYQIMTHQDHTEHYSPEAWQQIAPRFEGSWWPACTKWLALHSSGKVSPPPLGNAKAGIPILCDAPGTYVFQK